jgi:hypothetical protein
VEYIKGETNITDIFSRPAPVKMSLMSLNEAVITDEKSLKY